MSNNFDTKFSRSGTLLSGKTNDGLRLKNVSNPETGDAVDLSAVDH